MRLQQWRSCIRCTLRAWLRAAGDRQRPHPPVPGVRAKLLRQLCVQLKAAAGKRSCIRAVLPFQRQEATRLACM